MDTLILLDERNAATYFRCYAPTNISGATHLQIFPVLRTSRLFFNGCILIPVLRTSIYKYSRCYAPCKGFDQMGRLRSGNLFPVLGTYSGIRLLASGYWHQAAGIWLLAVSAPGWGFDSRFKNSKLARPTTANYWRFQLQGGI